NIGYADNAALYAIANFGVFGMLIFIVLLARLLFFSESKDRLAWTMLLFLLISGITTDIFESLGCLLFFGVAAKSLWLNTQEQRFRLNPRVMMSLRDTKSTL
ncbi:hypothetical protein QMN58_26725, partial [Escherichia coli]|nr:hypothetical protein [Escherichia coli]